MKDDLSISGRPSRSSEAYEYEPFRRRGGCLTTYLLSWIFGCAVGVFLFLFRADFIVNTVLLPSWTIPVGAIASGLGFIFAIAIWRWHRWGVFGMVMLVTFSLLLDPTNEHPILQPLLSFASVEMFGEDFASGQPILLAVLASLGLLGFLLRVEWDEIEP